MCSLNDCFENDISLINKSEVKPISNEVECKKCQSKDVCVLLRGKDAYCKVCFLTNTTHKFRAAIGKAKIIRRGDVVLVNHSGKANSTALLHLIKAGMHESAHKRLIFKTIVIYIDEGAIHHECGEERKATLEKIAKQVKDFGFEGYTACLADSLDNSLNIHPLNSQTISSEKDKNLQAAMSALSDTTAKEDFLRMLHRKLLISAARKLGCNKAFVADCTGDLAVEILSDISLGRGTQVSSDVNFCDCRNGNVMLLRPMRDFSKEEIAHYLALHNLSPTLMGNKINHDSCTSIRSLTKSFIDGLDSEYCGTVSTVFRTGEKLSTANSARQNEYGDCILCRSSLDTVLLDTTSAIDATAFSKEISTNGAHNVHVNGNMECGNVDNFQKESNKIQCSEQKVCNCTNGTRTVSLENFHKSLCYGCRLIFNGFRDINTVPSFLVKSVEERLSLMKMQEEIADFLI